MTELFNSSYEMELRLTVLLASNKGQMFSLDRMVSLDFISCYARKFGLPYMNLHGENHYMYSESV